MAVQKVDGLHTDVGPSNADLRGKEMLFCKRNTDGTIDLCGDGEVIAGVISEGKNVDLHTSFNTRGNPILRVIAGENIAAEAEVQSGANGVCKAGSTNAFGYTRKAVNSGEVAEIATYKTT